MNNDTNISQRSLMHDRGICVLIPTYNNVGSIDRVIDLCREQCDDVIVVNDGSTDGTAERLRQRSDIILVDYARNRGKGYALQCGFREAKKRGFAYAITIDADGQHYPSDIPMLLKANQQHPRALIIGSRQLEGVDRTRGSSFANKFSNFWFAVQTFHPLPDTQTGYRLYPLRHLYGLGFVTPRYEAELELLVMASWHGVELVSVPVNVYYPPRNERVSHYRPFADTVRISMLNIVLCVLALVYALPLSILRWLWRIVRTVYLSLFVALSMLFIVNPVAWGIIHFVRDEQRRMDRLHRFICFCTRFVVLRHGIIGSKVQYNVDVPVSLGDASVIVCNHQSHLDLLYLLSLSPNIIFLTNQWVWSNPLYGYIIRHAGYQPVTDSFDDIVPRLRTLTAQGYHVAVFPEGTRSEHCEIGHFHKGAFTIAQQLGIDVLPICLYGPGRILPKHGRYFRRWRVRVEVGKSLSQSELQSMGNDFKQAKTMRHHYQQWLQDISNKIDQTI